MLYNNVLEYVTHLETCNSTNKIKELDFYLQWHDDLFAANKLLNNSGVSLLVTVNLVICGPLTVLLILVRAILYWIHAHL